MRKALAAAVAAIVLLAGPAGQAQEKQEKDGYILGVLMCDKDPNTSGVTFILFSWRPVTCNYVTEGKNQIYEGKTGILLGLDLEYQAEDGMSYIVMGVGLSTDTLVGKYVGAKASVKLGGGVSSQAGLGGAGNGILLIPMGLGGGVGAGASAGLSYLELTKAK
jgi:hypothetical protein